MKMADYFTAPVNSNEENQTSTIVEQLPQPPKKNRERELESQLLDNVAINFIFSQGKKLNEGLIDVNRIYQIVEKIKQLARAQIDSGSKDIDYMQLVEFLKNKDLGFVENATVDDPFQEPEQEDDEVVKQERWDNIVQFMRNNPKLLMQMIPDPQAQIYPDYDSTVLQQADIVFKRSKAFDKIQDA